MYFSYVFPQAKVYFLINLYKNWISLEHYCSYLIGEESLSANETETQLFTDFRTSPPKKDMSRDTVRKKNLLIWK